MAQAPAGWRKLGIVAGGGDLPLRLAEHCRETARPYFVARIATMSDAALADHPGGEYALGAVGVRFKALKEAGCDAVVFAGIVKRPDFAALKLDARGALLLPRLVAAAGGGDDALLRVLVQECEKEGFRVVGADDVLGGLLAPRGAVGAHEPGARDHADIEKAARIAAALGEWDIGQGLVICEGLVLAVEAQEGTDEMLARVAALPETVRGRPDARRGLLLKRPKPQQERRIDLPTIGAATIEAAARAGLAGIAIEAGGALMLDRDGIVRLADAAGLFVYGFAPDAS